MFASIMWATRVPANTNGPRVQIHREGVVSLGILLERKNIASKEENNAGQSGK